MSSIAQEHSLFEIDQELDLLLEAMQEQIDTNGEASTELMDEFQRFCEAHGEKVDRIGRFIRMMEARMQFCKARRAGFRIEHGRAIASSRRPKAWSCIT